MRATWIHQHAYSTIKRVPETRSGCGGPRQVAAAERRYRVESKLCVLVMAAADRSVFSSRLSLVNDLRQMVPEQGSDLSFTALEHTQYDPSLQHSFAKVRDGHNARHDGKKDPRRARKGPSVVDRMGGSLVRSSGILRLPQQ